jgi:hypothetical protein
LSADYKYEVFPACILVFLPPACQAKNYDQFTSSSSSFPPTPSLPSSTLHRRRRRYDRPLALSNRTDSTSKRRCQPNSCPARATRGPR